MEHADEIHKLGTVKTVLTGEIADLKSKVVTSKEVIRVLTLEKESVLGATKALTEQYEQVKSDIVNVTADVEKFQATKGDLQSTCDSLNNQKGTKLSELANLSERISDARDMLERLQKQAGEQKDEAETQLKVILTKVTNAMEVYNKFRKEEQTVRTELAQERQRLDKREEVMRKREAEYLHSEKRMQEFSQFMKL